MPSRLISKMQRQYWRGYDEALDMIRTILHQFRNHSFTPDQNRLATAINSVVGELTPDEDLLAEHPTNSQLARKYAISLRTVTNWRREGCPFEDGQPHVLNWATEQRLLPRAFKARFARQLQLRRERDAARERLELLEAGVSELQAAVQEAKKAGIL